MIYESDVCLSCPCNLDINYDWIDCDFWWHFAIVPLNHVNKMAILHKYWFYFSKIGYVQRSLIGNCLNLNNCIFWQISTTKNSIVKYIKVRKWEFLPFTTNTPNAPLYSQLDFIVGSPMVSEQWSIIE